MENTNENHNFRIGKKVNFFITLSILILMIGTLASSKDFIDDFQSKFEERARQELSQSNLTTDQINNIINIYKSKISELTLPCPSKADSNTITKNAITDYLTNPQQTVYDEGVVKDMVGFCNTQEIETTNCAEYGKYSNQPISFLFGIQPTPSPTQPNAICMGVCELARDGASDLCDQAKETCDSACDNIESDFLKNLCYLGCDAAKSACNWASDQLFQLCADLCCLDDDPCTNDKYQNNLCYHNPITQCKNDDDCCPPGCDSSNDNDCGVTPSSTTTSTLPFNCPPWSCFDILSDPTLKAAVEKYDANNNGKIDKTEKQKAYEDYFKYGLISKEEACAVIIFNELNCDLTACVQGGVCYTPGAYCCENNQEFKCVSTGPPQNDCTAAGGICSTPDQCGSLCGGQSWVCPLGFNECANCCCICLGPTPSTTTTIPGGNINLPQCEFADSAGIWAKPKDCNWNHRVSFRQGGQESCTYLILKHSIFVSKGPFQGFVKTWGPAAIGESTDLCVIDPQSSINDLPKCPFSGDLGDVWAKPNFKVLIPGSSPLTWDWDTGRCKLGTDCLKKYEFTIPDLQVPGITIEIGPFKFDLQPDVGTIGLRVQTHASTPQRVYSGTKLLVVLTGTSALDLCVVKPAECTPGECNTQAKRYCLSGGIWSDYEEPQYCNNCQHCGDNLCNCGETTSTCSQDCKEPTPQCEFTNCEQPNELPCFCHGAKIPEGYPDTWCCGTEDGGAFTTKEECMRTSTCGTCDDYCKVAGYAEGDCKVSCPSGWQHPDTKHKCSFSQCCCRGSGDECPTLTSVRAFPSPASTSATFEAIGSKIDQIKVRIYDLAGSLVRDSNWQSGTTWIWDLKNYNSEYVANGVYPYKIYVKGCGNEKESGTEEIAVLRGEGTTTTTTTTTIPTNCVDSDNGQVYDVKGTCTSPYPMADGTDRCLDATMLREYYCFTQESCYFYDYPCPNGCEQGAGRCKSGETTTTTTTQPTTCDGYCRVNGYPFGGQCRLTCWGSGWEHPSGVSGMCSGLNRCCCRT